MLFSFLKAVYDFLRNVLFSRPDRNWTAYHGTSDDIRSSVVAEHHYVTLRDGTMLALTMYIPSHAVRARDRGDEIHLPIILQGTRYNRSLGVNYPYRLFMGRDFILPDYVEALVNYFVRSGRYIWCSFDVRGCGASTGTREFEVTTTDLLDLRELVDWVKNPDNCPFYSPDIGLGSYGVSFDGTISFLLGGITGVHASAVLFAPLSIYRDVYQPGGLWNAAMMRYYSPWVASLERHQIAQNSEIFTEASLKPNRFASLSAFVFSQVLREASSVPNFEGFLEQAAADHQGNYRPGEDMEDVTFADEGVERLNGRSLDQYGREIIVSSLLRCGKGIEIDSESLVQMQEKILSGQELTRLLLRRQIPQSAEERKSNIPSLYFMGSYYDPFTASMSQSYTTIHLMRSQMKAGSQNAASLPALDAFDRLAYDAPMTPVNPISPLPSFFRGQNPTRVDQTRPLLKLTLGPWTHCGLNFMGWGAISKGANRYPSFNFLTEMRRFFDYSLLHLDTGIQDEHNVHYYVMNKDRDANGRKCKHYWQSSPEAWPPKNIHETVAEETTRRRKIREQQGGSLENVSQTSTETEEEYDENEGEGEVVVLQRQSRRSARGSGRGGSGSFRQRFSQRRRRRREYSPPPQLIRDRHRSEMLPRPKDSVMTPRPSSIRTRRRSTKRHPRSLRIRRGGRGRFLSTEDLAAGVKPPPEEEDVFGCGALPGRRLALSSCVSSKDLERALREQRDIDLNDEAEGEGENMVDVFRIRYDWSSAHHSSRHNIVQMFFGTVSYVDLCSRRRQGSQVLTYTTPAFKADTIVTGSVRIHLDLAIDGNDAGVYVYVADWDPRKKVFSYMTEGRLRLLHRSGFATKNDFVLLETTFPMRTFSKQTARPMVPGQSEEVDIYCTCLSWMVKKGHQVKILVNGADQFNFIDRIDPEDRATTFTIRRETSFVEFPIDVIQEND